MGLYVYSVETSEVYIWDVDVRGCVQSDTKPSH